MDVSPIASQINNVLWYLISVGLLIATLKSPWFKGVVGEFIVNLSARMFLDKNKYHLIKNVTLPTEDGSTQIDHVIVSKYGVFVVETKNIKGWIFGSPNQKNWTQQIYKHKNQFQNPLHQNYKHTRVLADLLTLNPEQLFSVVVFVGDSTFKTEMPENVTYGMGYIRYIKSKTQPVLSETEVGKVKHKIESGRLRPSFKTNRAHVKHVKSLVANKNGQKQCPKCGSSMVLREAKKGKNLGDKFWGCSRFPKCKGVVKTA